MYFMFLIVILTSQNVQGVKWYAASDYDLQRYYNLSGSLLSRLCIPREAMNCRDTSCKTHHRDIESFYDSIINTLKTAAKKCIPLSKSSKFKPIPGWNDMVKDAHAEARSAFLLWQSNNKPRQGYIFEDMKVSRSRFKYALRLCKNK